jgi:hypothetical protein
VKSGSFLVEQTLGQTKFKLSATYGSIFLIFGQSGLANAQPLPLSLIGDFDCQVKILTTAIVLPCLPCTRIIKPRYPNDYRRKRVF